MQVIVGQNDQAVGARYGHMCGHARRARRRGVEDAQRRRMEQEKQRNRQVLKDLMQTRHKEYKKNRAYEERLLSQLKAENEA